MQVMGVGACLLCLSSFFVCMLLGPCVSRSAKDFLDCNICSCNCKAQALQPGWRAVSVCVLLVAADLWTAPLPD